MLEFTPGKLGEMQKKLCTMQSQNVPAILQPHAFNQTLTNKILNNKGVEREELIVPIDPSIRVSSRVKVSRVLKEIEFFVCNLFGFVSPCYFCLTFPTT